MSQLAPPPAPPRVTTSDEDWARRFRTRMLQVTATLTTLLLTAWFCTLGALPGILALVVAKHVLVAVLMMGLGIDEPQPDR
jgi:hypothetical protein